jgi:hypothetical protein
MVHDIVADSAVCPLKILAALEKVSANAEIFAPTTASPVSLDSFRE